MAGRPNQSVSTLDKRVGNLESGSVTALTYSPMEYGGVGDGTTDDHVAIQAAIHAANLGGGGDVDMRGHKWSIGATALYQEGSNIRFLGDPNTEITRTTTGNIFDSRTTNWTNWVFDTITFSGPVTQTVTVPTRGRTTTGQGAQTAIYISGDGDTSHSNTGVFTGLTIRNCTFKNCTALPILVAGTHGRVLVTGNRFYNNQDVGFTFNEEVIFTNNHIMASADNGVSLSRGNRKVVCVGNTLENCAYNGIWLSGFSTDLGPQMFAVTGNVIRNVGANGIIADLGPHDGVITGNYIYGGYYRGPVDEANDTAGAGVYIGGNTPRNTPTAFAYNIKVADNVCVAMARAGVYATGAKYCDIENNLLIDIGTQFLADGTTAISSSDSTSNIGVYVETSSTSSYLAVMNNRTIDTRGTPYCNYGVVPQSAPSNSAYQGNGMQGTRQSFNLYESFPDTRRWNTTQRFDQVITAILGGKAGTSSGTGTVNAWDVDGASTAVRLNRILTGGVARWGVGGNGTSESGSNVGTDYEIRNYTDAGSQIGTPFKITRSTGKVTIGNDLTVTGHKLSSASSATIAAGAQAASAAAASNGANDNSGTVSVTAVASPAAGTICTVTYATAYGTTPHVTITPRNAATVSAGLYVTSEGTTGFSVATASAAGASASLSFHYSVEGS